MKTLVTITSAWQDGYDRSSSTHLYIMEGKLDAGEAEAKLRDAVDQFFRRAGEGDIREAWEDSSGDFNWGDCLGQGYGTDYFEANGITEVRAGQPFEFDHQADVWLNHDEHLFPEDWAKRMEAADAAEQ